MDRIRDLFRQKDVREEYSPIVEDDNPMEGTALLEDDGEGVPFSWFEYSIFALLGMAMLWAWNMFLAAAPYFQLRFQSDVWITQNFQSAILTVSTITNLGAMLVLTNMQAAASYPFRINLALTINVVIFMLLTASTSIFLDASPALYLTFLLTMVAATALAARPHPERRLRLRRLLHISTVGGHPRKTVSPLTLLGKLHWLSAAVALCFAVSMFFPVFTGKILSVRTTDDGAAGSGSGSLFRPAAFIPLAFFVWNAGDLAGRMATALPFSLRSRPPLLLALAVARLVWLPLYLLCNVNGRGAVVASDLFYLVVVQFPFGLTNGWLGASCMMAGSEWVDEGEREVAGGFMGLCLVTGLTVGSILSFTVAGI
ncbi:nucleoside transporter family [Verticillium alfalfae VaMs.102]|uniref:Nucleoside transporter family n=1 Tax=Verticillium alfalfae (strain VaMs.102 / ATCC MYA-4576 / FGSC 10136) TaxID=526221 RepID=C9SVI9_VERA1|nr:nucleoside transporter family [Verticillium alfalfae VaMs.102]EEY22804.1 nucleoside transporter family [Verticillium alfalfae VaMs.102]